jgi:hypothetical protein
MLPPSEIDPGLRVFVVPVQPIESDTVNPWRDCKYYSSSLSTSHSLLISG